MCALIGAQVPRQALWFDEAGRLRPDAREAIALLEGAAADGLDPADYVLVDAQGPRRAAPVAGGSGPPLCSSRHDG